MRKRYREVVTENREWLILDTKGYPHRTICKCTGYDAPLNAEFICDALEAYHRELQDKFSFFKLSESIPISELEHGSK